MDSARDVCPLVVNGVVPPRSGERAEDAPRALLVTDARGVILDADHRAADLLGMSESALSGKLLIAFVARQDTRAFRKQLGQLAHLAETATTFEVRMRARGKTPFRATLSVTAAAPRSSVPRPPRYGWSVVPVAPTLAPSEAPGDTRSGRTRVDLEAVLGAAVAKRAALAERRGVRLEVHGAAGAPAALADEVRLRDAVGALLDTAIATAPAAGEVVVRITRDGEHVVLECSFEGSDLRARWPVAP